MAALTPARGKQPIIKAVGPYGHPLHPILVLIPMGAWMASLAFDIISRVSTHGSPSLSDAAYWLILAGVIGAVVSALFGLLDLLTIPRRTRALRVGVAHMVLMLGIVALFFADWYWRHISESYEAAKVHPGQLMLSAVGVVLLLATGWLGGINDPVKVDRRVSPTGHILVGTQQINIGETYARKTVTVFFRGDFLHIEIEPGRSINVPRASGKQPARFEARANDELPHVPWQEPHNNYDDTLD